MGRKKLVKSSRPELSGILESPLNYPKLGDFHLVSAVVYHAFQCLDHMLIYTMINLHGLESWPAKIGRMG